ncbi:hypothetical protein M378DRAFT_180162 [Amanita muscaria Koide BX008]|uniref:Uncharacterized protein n=1 Tax=Amanita muscaria (strain Koide BX008) TaxID=946122 RepID=A0A0C2WWC4_AMAMK|nr:hypothetical protein M378DRAFT_180162 [Amanita muscaria Koide BX008]
MSKRKQGALNAFLPTNTPSLDMIKQVKTMYDEQWAAFIQDIHDSIDNDSEIYQQEEEERKRAEVERLPVADSEAQEGDNSPPLQSMVPNSLKPAGYNLYIPSECQSTWLDEENYSKRTEFRIESEFRKRMRSKSGKLPSRLKLVEILGFSHEHSRVINL